MSMTTTIIYVFLCCFFFILFFLTDVGFGDVQLCLPELTFPIFPLQIQRLWTMVVIPVEIFKQTHVPLLTDNNRLCRIDFSFSAAAVCHIFLVLFFSYFWTHYFFVTVPNNMDSSHCLSHTTHFDQMPSGKLVYDFPRPIMTNLLRNTWDILYFIMIPFCLHQIRPTHNKQSYVAANQHLVWDDYWSLRLVG